MREMSNEYIWDKQGLPHKGWTEVTIIDLGDDSEFCHETCEMCGKEHIRYVHVMRHPDVDNELRVGCVCACKMTDDYENPVIRERELKNKANRRMNFLRQDWNVNWKGNYVLRYKGKYITIFRARHGQGWGIALLGFHFWKHNGQPMNTLSSAKIAAFDYFDNLTRR